MKRILFLPFLSIPSGHHQAADALMAHIESFLPSAVCRKVDLLRFGYGSLESVVSQFYLKWIELFPKSYNRIYQKSVTAPVFLPKRFPLYELIFEKSINKLIREEKPELIFCTHALPSYLLGEMKRRKRLSVPVINVYTDFFINHLWGSGHIDYHFVPGPEMKNWLMDNGVDETRIFVTGIPVHPHMSSPVQKQTKPPYTVLIAGGSLGVGSVDSLIRSIGDTDKIRYLVLCGKNKALRQALEKMNPNIVPLPYISSREEMNQLYNQVDVILTKPGGLTISECLRKRIPILVYHALPAQEQMNLELLKRQGLVIDVQKIGHSFFEQFLLHLLNSAEQLKNLRKNMDLYSQMLTHQNLSPLLDRLIRN